MKMAVSSAGQSLDAQLDPRFGRCQWFLVIETDDMQFEVLENSSANLGSGAGIQAAQLVASRGAEALITGYCGPKAVKTLQAAGIKLYQGLSGKIGDLVQDYLQGKLVADTRPNVPAHSGSGMGAGMRRGAGSGGMAGRRAMGAGRGRRRGGNS